jgi:predicted TPR repeat methyltransferase
MTQMLLSSGDLIADRRATYAEMLAENGEHAAAADLMRDALGLAPGWAAGWFRLGTYLKAADRIAEAIDAWRETLRLDPADRFGALLELELAGGVLPGGIAPSGFAEALFDQYADRFEASLVGKLDYRAPQMLVEAIAASGTNAFARAFDLGCGTGLMGERLRGLTSFLEGCDVSARMLAKADAKRIYDRLQQVDLQTLEAGDARYDLVTAADVFMYLGNLDRLFATVAAMLAPGGLFAFTAESHDGDEPMVLRPSRRYAHADAYLRDLIARSGFEIVHFATAAIRRDRDEAVNAHVVVVRLARSKAAPAIAMPAVAETEQLTLH